MRIVNEEIRLLTYLPPSSNPRIIKEARALAEAGFRVTVVTSALPGSGRIPMEEPDFCRIEHIGWRVPSMARWRHRLVKRLAPLWPLDLRSQVASYGSLFVDLVSAVSREAQAMPFVAHLEPALLAAGASGRLGQICCDFEDWYSQDLLPGRRSAGLTAKLKEIEAKALSQAPRCWCPAETMAADLAATYNVQAPLVIRNVFPRRLRESIDGRWLDRPLMRRHASTNVPAAVRPQAAPVSIHWVSQTIGPGRGLEDVFSALHGLAGGWELHLRGGLGGYADWLEEVCPREVRARLTLHPLVSPDELTSRVAEHDVGLACELTKPRNKDVTISNKMFQYLQAGLAVVASDTRGQREAAGLGGEGVALYRSGDAQALRVALETLVTDRSVLARRRAAAWGAGERLCWENEAPKLVEAVREVVFSMRASETAGAGRQEVSSP